MRALADHLGVVPMALYRHFDNKEDLLDAMVDAAAAQLQISPPPDGPWDAQLSHMMTELYEQLLQQPSFVRLRAARPMLSPGALRFTDQAVAVLQAAGFSNADAARAYRTLFIFVFGSAAFGVVPDAAVTEGAARAALAALPPAEYPAIAANLTELAASMSDRDLFSFGLDRLLAGLAALQDAGESRDL